jgi:anti-anti-sigma regulatory factor
MSVSETPASGLSSIMGTFWGLFEIQAPSQSLIVSLGRRKDLSDAQFARCREEIARLTANDHIDTVVFDLAGILVLPSSVLGLIAAVSQGEAKVRVINASHCAREDFQLTGLDRMIELDPPTKMPPSK